MIKLFRQICSNRSVNLKVWLTGFILVCLQTSSFAANSEAGNPAEKIFINADYMQLNIQTGNSIYIGNVKISQGDLILTGDRVTIEQTDDEIERITVIGKPAHYNHITEKGENIQAESEHMVYTSSQNKLVMTVDAKLLQPDHEVSSQKIIYDTDKKIVIAGEKNASPSDDPDNNQRVNITLTPKKESPQP